MVSLEYSYLGHWINIKFCRQQKIIENSGVYEFMIYWYPAKFKVLIMPEEIGHYNCPNNSN